ncbi:glycosyltransferase family A protein [Rubellicoccus peritrichatus]|uniref:Glycosyltransferase family A protein n=1 Tax=Rubellicoccus peritrichatus TaxID=3080537 RepID=A0AAQ3LDY6_9BACT|nr:glycosyltransferase family A protein [Puniceicoccus sp. CR14]WOO42684.1 glycosyltransferase family A protein [Puniceicoccus sp. CR14]
MSQTPQSTKQAPLISCIIALYNGEAFIREAIDSIIAQSYPNIEILVINDGSTDSGPDIAKTYSEVRIINQENQGEAAARNRGIAEARGDMIAFLDHDDYWHKDKLQTQVDALLADSSLGYVLCRVNLIHEAGAEDLQWATEKEKTEKHGAFYPSAILGNKSTFDTIGPFNEKAKVFTDVDWFARANDLGIKNQICPERLLYRRFHSDNLTRHAQSFKENIFGALFESVKRKKEQAKASQL